MLHLLYLIVNVPGERPSPPVRNRVLYVTLRIDSPRILAARGLACHSNICTVFMYVCELSNTIMPHVEKGGLPGAVESLSR